MIFKIPFEEGLYGPGVDTRYFGDDAKNFLENINWHEKSEYIGKECITSHEGKRGIIIGFEDSQCAADYYYIVFIPDEKKIVYELANYRPFIESIIL